MVSWSISWLKQMLLHPLMMDFSFCILAEPKVGQVEAECPKEASVSPNSSALYLKSWSPPSAIFFNSQPILATLLTQIRALSPNLLRDFWGRKQNGTQAKAPLPKPRVAIVFPPSQFSDQVDQNYLALIKRATLIVPALIHKYFPVWFNFHCPLIKFLPCITDQYQSNVAAVREAHLNVSKDHTWEELTFLPQIIISSQFNDDECIFNVFGYI